MNKKIKKVGVIGAGVMGATIAAQLANVGLETFSSTLFFHSFQTTTRRKDLPRKAKSSGINSPPTVCRAP